MTAAADITIYTQAELEAMTKQNLLDIASARGVNIGSGSPKKADIINAILENQGNEVV